jgi:hypothetical protein
MKKRFFTGFAALAILAAAGVYAATGLSSSSDGVVAGLSDLAKANLEALAQNTPPTPSPLPGAETKSLVEGKSTLFFCCCSGNSGCGAASCGKTICGEAH